MTPTGIKLGKLYEARPRLVSLPTAATTRLSEGHSSRVAFVVALTPAGVVALGAGGLSVGPLIDGVLVPLTCLTAGHPVCYLSVDKIGSSFFPELYASHSAAGSVDVGVTNVRLNQEFPQ